MKYFNTTDVNKVARLQSRKKITATLQDPRESWRWERGKSDLAVWEKYVNAAGCFLRWTNCRHTFILEVRLQGGGFTRAERSLGVPLVLLDPERLNKFSPEHLRQIVDRGGEWQRAEVRRPNIQSSGDPDLLLIQTRNDSRPSTVPDPLLFQTLY